MRPVPARRRGYGQRNGALKFSYVLEKLYAALPAFFKIVIPFPVLQKWIEEALASAKEEWAKEAGVELYIEEGTANAEGMWRELSNGKGEE